MGKLKFFASEAFSSLRRNYFMTIAAVLTVLLSMTVLGVVMVFASGIDGLLTDLKEKVEITVYLKSDATSESIEAMHNEVLGWEEVKEVTFVSKEQALERLREDFKDHPEILDSLKSNPLPASFEIALKDPEQVDAVAGRFEGRAIVDEVRYGKEIADRIFRVTSVVQNVLLVFIVLLAVVAVLLISNTIRLSIFARRREVEIMKLVGATNWFIRWPFMIEGLAVGLAGAAVALVIVVVGSNVVIGRIQQSLVFMSVPFESVPLGTVAGLLIVAGAAIGVLGSGLGLRRFLNV